MDTIVGTYSGNSECDAGADAPNGPITYTVEFISGNSYSATDQDGGELLFTADGCDITIPELEFEFFGIMIATSGDGSLDGNQMNLNINTTVDDVSFTCRATTTKQ